jgi:hypothetical protein
LGCPRFDFDVRFGGIVCTTKQQKGSEVPKVRVRRGLAVLL